MDMYDESPRHRKKHSQKSKSVKRADHKHVYERVILQAIIGWRWGGRCRICGRLDGKWGFSSKEFLRPESRKKPAIGNRDFYSEAELHRLFPDTPVYKYGRLTEHEGYTLSTPDLGETKDI